MAYLSWDQKTITDWSDAVVAEMYAKGYVFTRLGKGVMDQTRSCRIKLSDFEPSSENRRIMRKNENLKLDAQSIPFAGYSWEMGKLAKDFYESRDAEFSANKIKELITDTDKSSFNALLRYNLEVITVGYAICYENPRMLHYSYPFYNEDPAEPSRGLGMMLLAINYAKEKGLEYIYLGSLQRPSDTYKLQFKGLEWFDGKGWQAETDSLKEILK